MRHLEPVDITANTNHTGAERLGGFSVHEAAATAAAATVRFRRETATGQIIFVLELAANESASIVLPAGEYVPSGGGVYVEVVAGTVEGVLFDKR